MSSVKQPCKSNPSKVPNYRACRVSMLGVAVMVLGRYRRYLIGGYLDN